MPGSPPGPANPGHTFVPGNPTARPGYVCSQTFDHTSVLKLAQEKWNLPALTARAAAARAPLDALDLAGEPAFLEPPVLPEPTLRWGTW